MRDSTRTAFGNLRTCPDDANIGLVFERFAPIALRPGDDEATRPELGRVLPKGAQPHLFGGASRDDYIDWLAARSVPDHYARAYARWVASLAASGSMVVRVTAASRLVPGHGNPSGLESGLSFHRTYGTPHITGSSLKGVLNHYLACAAESATVGGDAPWRGVGYERAEKTGSPVTPPGRLHGALFGAPAFPGHPDAHVPAVRDGLRGGVVFEDAWYVPDSLKDGKPFAADVLTPHQFAYYSARGVDKHGNPVWPSDWDDPNPVSFLTLRPGAGFLLAVTGPTEAARFALRALVQALADWGIGAKTRAGYGRFRRLESPNVEPASALLGRLPGPRQRAAIAGGAGAAPAGPVAAAAAGVRAQSAALMAFREAAERVLNLSGAEVGTVVERFEREFLRVDRVEGLSPDEARGAARLELEKMARHPKLSKKAGESLARVGEQLAERGNQG